MSGSRSVTASCRTSSRWCWSSAPSETSRPRSGILGRNRAGLELLHHALDGFDSPYAEVAAALLTVVPTGMAGPKAAELAASGPPTEMVGLTPFIPVESLRVGART